MWFYDFFLIFSDFAGARVGSVGRLRGRRDIDAQSAELSILRKVRIYTILIHVYL